MNCMKESFYFSHDYEPTSDPKIQALLGEYGWLGYGVFWRIVEMLHSDQDHKIPMKPYIYLALAKQMKGSIEEITAIINFCIEVAELFTSDGEYFWSDRVIRNLEKRIEAVAQRKEAWRRSAVARAQRKSTTVERPLNDRWTTVERVSTTGQRNPTKERKGKDIKEKEIDTTETIETESKAISISNEIDTPAKRAMDFFCLTPRDIAEKMNITEQHRDAFESEVNKFQKYWLELNKSGTKHRWQLEKTFDISLRLSNWFTRAKMDFTSYQQKRWTAHL